jgi:hypothetical protein
MRQINLPVPMGSLSATRPPRRPGAPPFTVVNVHIVAFGDLCDDLTCGRIGDVKFLAGSSR